LLQDNSTSALKGKQKFFTILILGLLSAIGPCSIDMYLPGFTGIAADLKTTVPDVALSLSSFFIGICFGQFLYGPLLDRYGRKPPLYAGLSLYLIASAGCVFAASVNTLIILRLFEGIGSCAGMVAARAYVRDIFPVDEIAKVFSMLMLVIAVSPIIAPTAGGFIATHLGWHYIFVVLFSMAAFLLCTMHLALPKGRAPDKSLSLKPKPITKNFLSVIKNPQFSTYTFTGAFASAGLYAYIAGSPHVFMELYKLTEQQYGWLFAIIAMGLITASQLNSLLLRKYSSSQIIRIALICQSLTAIIMCVGIMLNLLDVFGIIACIFCFLSCQGFTFPNASALSLVPFERNAGTASALLGAIQMATGTLSSAMVSVFSNSTAIPMALIMTLCATTALTILLTGRRVLYSRAKKQDIQDQVVETIITS